MLLYFQSWAGSKEIKLQHATIYHSQTNGQSEILNKEIAQVAKACQAKAKQ